MPFARIFAAALLVAMLAANAGCCGRRATDVLQDELDAYTDGVMAPVPTPTPTPKPRPKAKTPGTSPGAR